MTLLSGFLGAGKTTLMQNVLRQAREERLSLSVIVNDMVRDGECREKQAEGDRDGEAGEQMGREVGAEIGREKAGPPLYVCCTLPYRMRDIRARLKAGLSRAPWQGSARTFTPAGSRLLLHHSMICTAVQVVHGKGYAVQQPRLCWSSLSRQ